MRFTLDTNILVYSLDVTHARKRELAQWLLVSADPFRCVILLQTLAELCNVVTRKQPHHAAELALLVTRLQRLHTIASAAGEDVPLALEAHREHQLPFWDAMIWASAQRTGCNLLLTEDFQDGRTLGSVTFRNPFTMHEPELTQLLG